MSVREDIVSNVVSTLQGISAASGYNNTLASTQVTRDVQNFRDNDGYDRKLVVMAVNEEQNWVDIGGNYMEARLTVRVEGRVRATSNIETEINQLIDDVETALCADGTRGSLDGVHYTAPAGITYFQGVSDDELIFRYDFEVEYDYIYGSP
jgi:hypothetical protein